MFHDKTEAKPEGMSRRKLLSYSCMATGLALAGTLGYQFRSVTPPKFPTHPLDSVPDQAPRMLVVYASMMGSTGRQASVLADTAHKAGYVTQLARVEEQPDPMQFDAVMLGSAIKGGRWLPEMLDWASANETAIATRPHALFQCSMRCAGLRQAHPDHSLSRKDLIAMQSDLDAIYTIAPSLRAAPVSFFGGCLDFDRLSPGLRIGYVFASGSFLNGDFSRPEQLRAYAKLVMDRPEFAKLKTT